MFRPSRLLAGACLAGTAVIIPVAVAPSAQAAGINPGFGTNGRVRVMVASGNLIYVGGSFTRVIDGGGQHAAGNVGVYNTSTQRFELSFSPRTNGVVAAMAVNGGTVYLGGEFTQVNGAAAGHIAAVSASNGALVRTFTADASGNVDALLIGPNGLYAAGNFKSVNSVSRANVARLSLDNGQPDGWDPGPNGRVRALALSGSTVFLGGAFSAVHGSTSHNKVGKVNTDPTGTLADFRAGNTSGAGHQPVLSMAVGGDGTLLLGVGGSGGACTSMSATGTQRWTARTDGDVQAAEIVGSLAWCGGHFNAVNGTDQRKLVAFNALTGKPDGFNIDINSALGVWSLEAMGSTLLGGGDFTKAGGDNVNHILSVG